MVKQIIVIRTDLKMSVGKTASQAAHASMKVLLDRGYVTKSPLEEPAFLFTLTPELWEWVSSPFTKIVVGCGSEQEMLDIQATAIKAGVLNAIIKDNNTTYTALAVGPATAETLAPITGHLKLL